jgi:predicted MFS family arabinose efflux permease
MMIGMAIIAVSDLGTALATNLPILMLCRLGLGWGRSLSEAGERGLLFDLAKRIPSLRGRALAAQQAVVALGITIGAPAGGIVVEQYGPRAAFLCVSVGCFVALILYSFLPETVIVGQDLKEVHSNNNNSGKDQNLSGTEIWIDLLKTDQWRGLALCQSGASFGFVAKIASIPILAASILPGGAAGGGALLSAAGVSGLVGSTIGGWTSDRIGPKKAALISGILSGLGLILVPVVLNTRPVEIGSIAIGNVPLESNAFFFSLAVMGWSFGATAQAPALTSIAQQYSPPGIEATSLSLVKAAGDGTYIIVPFLLGLLADRFTNIQGVECALAGSAICLGTLALAVLVDDPGNNKTI